MSELLEPTLLTGEGKGSPYFLSGWNWGFSAALRKGTQDTLPQPELHSVYPVSLGGYYLTSLSASLALLSGLSQAGALPLSPAQELQRSLALWEQRRLPATHSFQVKDPSRYLPHIGYAQRE